MPPFRLDLYPHAFGEGWGCIRRSSAREMGMHQRRPYDEFGRLTYEMARVPARGRYRYARQGLVTRPRHGVSREQYGAVAARSAHRDRPLHRVAGPGARVQDGGLKILELRARAHDALAASASTCALSMMRCLRMAACRCRSWSTRSTSTSPPHKRNNLVPGSISLAGLRAPDSTPDVRRRAIESVSTRAPGAAATRMPSATSGIDSPRGSTRSVA